jgi:mono/diheme cytochrome c family protein
MRSVYVLAVAVLLLAGAFASRAAVVAAPADTPAIQAQMSGGDINRGRYIVENVAMCVECHSPRDAQGNIIESRKFQGAPVPVRPPWPNEWALIAPRNAGLPGYDDQQAMRLLTQGAIGRDGQQLRPPMPRFRMTPQDAADVIAFMRSLR